MRLVTHMVLPVLLTHLITMTGSNSQEPDRGRLEQSVRFANRVWKVKTGRDRGPGPNNWSAEKSCVRVDDDGNLHLGISQDQAWWNCAEVTATQSLGYGEYRWVISGDLPALSARSILGLFLYEDDDHEIDFELSRWGKPGAPNAQFVLQPSAKDSLYRFDLGTAKRITCGMNWSASTVHFRCWVGEDTREQPLAEWTYKGAKVPKAGRERVHMNFWLFKGKNLAQSKSQEVVIHSFRFTPQR